MAVPTLGTGHMEEPQGGWASGLTGQSPLHMWLLTVMVLSGLGALGRRGLLGLLRRVKSYRSDPVYLGPGALSGEQGNGTGARAGARLMYHGVRRTGAGRSGGLLPA